MNVFHELDEINHKPKPFEFYTTRDLWTEKYISKKMLEYHLDESIDAASRKKVFIESSVDWISSFFDIDKKTEIIDFGCGPGLYTIRFAERGAKVTGVDFSKRSLDYAKKSAKEKRLEIDYVWQDYLSFNMDKKYDLITMIFCDFCVLNPAQRQQMIRIFKKHLKPDGYLLLDVCSLNAFEKIQEKSNYEVNLMDRFWSPNKYYGFINTFKYEKEKVSLDKYTIIEKNRSFSIYNWLQYYSVESINREFAKNNMEIVNIYSDVSGKKYSSTCDEFAIIVKNK